MIRKSLLIWLLIIPLAILNGALRQEIIVPLIGVDYALPLSGISLMLLIFIVSYFGIPRLGKAKQAKYILMGIWWIALTVLFEFGMGVFILKKPFAELIEAYNPSTGNLWLFVVLFIGIAPLLAAKLRKTII